MSVNFSCIKCQQCGGEVELNFDKLISFCPYCGTKLLIEVDDLAGYLKEKEKTNQTKIKYDSENIKDSHDFNSKILLVAIWVATLLLFTIGCIFTIDRAGFSIFEIFIIIDLIVGFRTIKHVYRK